MESKYLSLLDYQINTHYLTPREIKYATDSGFCLSPYEYEHYLESLEETGITQEPFVTYPLRGFNASHFYLCQCLDFRSLYREVLNLINEDYETNGSLLSKRGPFGFDRSRICSEIEGSLNVENVPTTRRKLKALLEEGAKPADRNDTIIRNMGRAIEFIKAKPDFNKDNLHRLYVLLTEGCLDEEDQLRPDEFYRYDGVEVDGYPGCPVEQIEACMDSLFDFVNQQLKTKSPRLGLILPHVCHYYIVYIHPYFDYNGRTARMVSFWVNLLLGNESFPPLISEAINQTKSQYYKAIRDSRDAHNDLTYFILYLLKTTVSYYLAYKKLEGLAQTAKDHGVFLTETELHYVKCILLNSVGAFTEQDFQRFCRIAISKQGALKILNKFVSAGVLLEVSSGSKTKLFALRSGLLAH